MAIPPFVMKLVVNFVRTVAIQNLQKNPGFQRLMQRANLYVEEQLKPHNIEKNVKTAKQFYFSKLQIFKRTLNQTSRNFQLKKK